MLTARLTGRYGKGMCGCLTRFVSHLIVLLTAVSTLAAGVPLSSTLPCPNTGERCVVSCEDSGRGQDAVKPRSGEDSERSEEEESSSEVDILLEHAIVVGRGDEAFSYVSVAEGTSGDRRHSPKSSIRGPPAA